ncbi:T9SS C-terminal target domain-containing protein, partial [Lutibacter sp. HS1-25]|uniref:T9SS type A sorting domain-containing protein n=1 Tax=Lutibacter sp. HS1-25 TaxID=2485000 RepID=UPI0010106780
LDELGNASITAVDIDNGSNDACGILSLEADNSFDCSNVGANTVTLTVTDNNNNVSTTTAIVTVEDNVLPQALAKDITVQLDEFGNASITASDIDNGSNDACGILSLEADNSFDCSNVGPNTVTLTVTDNNNNVSTTTAVITVEDNVLPVITCVENSSRYIDPYQTYYTVSQTEFNASATDACGIASLTYVGGLTSTSGTSMDGVQLDLGDNTIVWKAVDVNANESTCTTVITVQKRPTSITYNGDLSEQYSDSVDLSATLVDDVSGNGIQGKTIIFTIGTQSISAVTNANGVAATSLILTQNPANIYTVNAEFLEDASYLASTDEKDFDISQEDAIVEYTGQTLQATPSSSSSETMVVLSANIQDITVSDGINDPYAGDIRNAKVKFVNRDNGTDISGWINVVDLINSNDSRTGNVTFNWNVNIGSSDAESTTVGIIVDNGYYIRNQSDDNMVITVYKPVGDFITGGGYIMPVNSEGVYASTSGLKTNFGFNVKYNKKGNKLKGHMNVIFRRLESDGLHIYQVKGNAIQSLGVNIENEENKTAQFITKANLTDITDPLNTISLGGNLFLKVEMSDKGEPGKNDLIGFNLTKNGELFYSSNWSGIKTNQMLLSGGNLVVHSGFNLGSVDGDGSNGGKSEVETEIITLGLFEVSAWPNPSKDKFNLSIKSVNSEAKVEVFVFDISGKLMHYAQGKANENYQFGEQFASGVYTLKVVQSSNVEFKRLIKD